MHIMHFKSSYKDELIATAAVLSLIVVGSFYLLGNYYQKSETGATIVSLNFPNESSGSQEQVLGEQSQFDEVLAPTLVPTITLVPIPTENPLINYVAYGLNQEISHDAYTIIFDDPRIAMINPEAGMRTFYVNVLIVNHTDKHILPAKLKAAIVKDGRVISQAVTLNLVGGVPIGGLQSKEFQASLPLIDSTDVSELIYDPGNGLPESRHYLP